MISAVTAHSGIRLISGAAVLGMDPIRSHLRWQRGNADADASADASADADGRSVTYQQIGR